MQEQSSVLNTLNLLGNEDAIVLIITKEGCSQCTKTKELLKTQNIDFMEVKYESLSKT
ncbi:MAG TPA: glutaredoxin domain-containing protein [Clostridia bacterium]|nr:glutaredoxin domain-containing protein [Clostridia bacterium]